MTIQSKKFKVLVTHPILDEGIKHLKQQGFLVRVLNASANKHSAAIKRELRHGYDALLCLLTDRIDALVMDAGLPRLKVIANYAVGFDNIDLAAAKARHLIVTNTPALEVMETVAEHTFMLMLALARRVVESDKFTRSGQYHGWEPKLLLGTDVYGKQLGIVGLGRIGQAVARRAHHGFQMKIIYTDVRRDKKFEKEYQAVFMSLPRLLRQADIVSLHVPLLPTTRHLISTKEFNLMKPTAFLINTARGPVVDEKALLRALKNKKIGGVALDVFECEPSIDCDLTDHLALKSFSNVVLTPHTASATIEARQAMSRTAAINIIEALRGRTPPNLVFKLD